MTLSRILNVLSDGRSWQTVIQFTLSCDPDGVWLCTTECRELELQYRTYGDDAVQAIGLAWRTATVVIEGYNSKPGTTIYWSEPGDNGRFIPSLG